MSRCASLSVIQSTGIAIGRNNSPACTICPSYGGVNEKGRLTTKSTSNDSVCRYIEPIKDSMKSTDFQRGVMFCFFFVFFLGVPGVHDIDKTTYC